MTGVQEVLSHSPEETFEIGRRLGRVLAAGDVLALSGPLGAGKTHFIKGVAAGLGVDPSEPLVSPTFVLVREYAGRLRLVHCDAYRLAGAEEFEALGLEEQRAAGDAVLAVEWADRVAAALPADRMEIELAHEGASARRLRLRHPAGERFAGAWNWET